MPAIVAVEANSETTEGTEMVGRNQTREMSSFNRRVLRALLACTRDKARRRKDPRHKRLPVSHGYRQPSFYILRCIVENLSNRTRRVVMAARHTCRTAADRSIWHLVTVLHEACHKSTRSNLEGAAHGREAPTTSRSSLGKCHCIPHRPPASP